MFKVTDLEKVLPDPSPDPGKTWDLVPEGEQAALHTHWCDLRESSGYYDEVGYLELKSEPRVSASCRGVVKGDSGSGTRVSTAYSTVWRRLYEAAVAQEGVTSRDSSEECSVAIANLLQRTATEPELSLAFPPGRESAAELRVRLGYGGSDPSRTGGIIKYLMEVLQHCPTLLLVFADNKGETLPLGNAGTANAAVVAHSDALGVSQREHCTLSTRSACCASWRRRGAPRLRPLRPLTCERLLWPCACPLCGLRRSTAGQRPLWPPLASRRAVDRRLWWRRTGCRRCQGARDGRARPVRGAAAG